MANILVGQSGGPTAVINASLAGAAAAALAAGGRVYGMRHGIQGFCEGGVVDLTHRLADAQALQLLQATPGAFLGSCRRRLPSPADDPELYRSIFAALEELDVQGVLYIGGNDSMDTILRLHDYAAASGSRIRFVGVPKTVDNDLPLTDHTPGYASAARYVAIAIKELVCDSLVYDEPRVTLVEIMGRNAGWLTGATALAAGEDCPGADLIYLPEVPFDPQAMVEKVAQLQRRPGRRSVVVALSEGIRLADGRYVCELADTAQTADVFGHRQLAGAGAVLAGLLQRRLGAKCRAVELSTMQRCAAHLASGVDAREAFAVGEAGVRAVLEGHSGVMVTLQRAPGEGYACRCGLADVHAVANRERTVPCEWIAPDGAGVLPAFTDWARPLLAGEAPALWRDGLPRHLTL